MRLHLDIRDRYVVYDERRTYGCYRSLRMAFYRKQQVENSRRPRPGLRRYRPENRP